MKKLVLIVVVVSAMFACNSNPSDQITGTWVTKDAEVNNDTLFIDKIDEDNFHLRGHLWNTGKKKVFAVKVIFKDNTIYLPDGKYLTFTEDQEFLIDGDLYKNLE